MDQPEIKTRREVGIVNNVRSILGGLKSRPSTENNVPYYLPPMFKAGGLLLLYNAGEVLTRYLTWSVLGGAHSGLSVHVTNDDVGIDDHVGLIVLAGASAALGMFCHHTGVKTEQKVQHARSLQHERRNRLIYIMLCLGVMLLPLHEALRNGGLLSGYMIFGVTPGRYTPEYIHQALVLAAALFVHSAAWLIFFYTEMRRLDYRVIEGMKQIYVRLELVTKPETEKAWRYIGRLMSAVCAIVFLNMVVGSLGSYIFDEDADPRRHVVILIILSVVIPLFMLFFHKAKNIDESVERKMKRAEVNVSYNLNEQGNRVQLSWKTDINPSYGMTCRGFLCNKVPSTVDQVYEQCMQIITKMPKREDYRAKDRPDGIIEEAIVQDKPTIFAFFMEGLHQERYGFLWLKKREKDVRGPLNVVRVFPAAEHDTEIFKRKRDITEIELAMTRLKQERDRIKSPKTPAEARLKAMLDKFDAADTANDAMFALLEKRRNRIEAIKRNPNNLPQDEIDEQVEFIERQTLDLLAQERGKM